MDREIASGLSDEWRHAEEMLTHEGWVTVQRFGPAQFIESHGRPANSASGTSAAGAAVPGEAVGAVAAISAVGKNAVRGGDVACVVIPSAQRAEGRHWGRTNGSTAWLEPWE
jgi:hypothetical protein